MFCRFNVTKKQIIYSTLEFLNVCPATLSASITSAPKSPKNRAANAPDKLADKSSTRMSENALLINTSFRHSGDRHHSFTKLLQ